MNFFDRFGCNELKLVGSVAMLGGQSAAEPFTGR